MPAYIKKLFTPPVFESEEKTRVANLLNTILLAILLIMLVWLPISLLINSDKAISLMTLGTVLLLSISSLVGLYYGYVRLVSHIFALSVWMVVFVASYVLGGLHNPGIYSCTVVVLVAGLLLGGRAAIIYAVLSIVAGLGLYYLEITGLLPASFISHTLLDRWFVLAINVILAAALFFLAVNNIRGSITRASREIAERKQTEEHLQRLARQHQQLFEASQAIMSTLALDEVIQQTMYALQKVLPFDMFGLYWLDEEAGVLRPYAITGLQQFAKTLSEWLVPADKGITGAVIKSGKAVLVNNAQLDSRAVYPQEMRPAHNHLISIPIKSQSKTVGVFNISRLADPPFIQEEFKLAQLFITQANVAINNAQLYSETKQQAKELSTLLETSQAISSTIDLEQVLTLIAKQMVIVVDVTGCTLSRWDQENNTVITWVEWRQKGRQFTDPPGTSYSLDRFSATKAVLEQRTPVTVAISDASTDPNEAALLQRLETTSLLMLPLAVGERVIGLVELDDETERHFTPAEIQLCQALTNQAAVAIENARLYQQAQQEIAERIRVEEELRESELKYRGLVERMGEGLSQTSNNGIIEFVNTRFCQMLGYSEDELLGVQTWQLLWQNEDKEVLAEKIRLRNLGLSDQYELQLKKKSGESIWVHISASPVINKNGTVTGIIGIHTDITERKQAEAINTRLEEQLRQAQKMEAVGTLAGGIAHDFNNMLTAIMGYTDLSLEALSPDHPVYQDLEGIQKIAHRAANLTRQLLAFARRQIIEPVVLDLNELIINLTPMLRRLIGEGIELVILPAPDLGYVKADTHQLEQVLVNLVVNAYDAISDNGKVIIETANTTLDDTYLQDHGNKLSGEYVMLAVTDTGTGMAEEVKTHVFEPFFTTKEVGQGTGLGLATCFGIVKQNKGHIEIYSEVNKGTTVKVYLPCIKESISLKTEDTGSNNLPQGKETILLVEDEPSVRYLSVRMLQHQGYTVLEAGNGNEALQVIKGQINQKIDLLVTDIVMPQMGGKPLADQIRAEYPDLKILFMSGYTNTALSDTLGPRDAFLQKPFTPEVLARKVREVLDSAY